MYWDEKKKQKKKQSQSDLSKWHIPLKMWVRGWRGRWRCVLMSRTILIFLSLRYLEGHFRLVNLLSCTKRYLTDAKYKLNKLTTAHKLSLVKCLTDRSRRIKQFLKHLIDVAAGRALYVCKPHYTTAKMVADVREEY